MVLYTEEARQSWKDRARDLRKVINEVHGAELSYHEKQSIDMILEMFCQYVDKESKAAR